MLIRIERSGGVSGISKTSEIDSTNLPPTLSDLSENARGLANKKSRQVKFKATKPGSADYYNYKISFGEGKDQIVIECNENNIQEDLKSLVKYVEKHTK